MIKERFIELIDKYLSGTASADERLLIQEYLTRLEETDKPATLEGNQDELKEAMWLQIQRQTTGLPVPVFTMPWYRRKAFRWTAIAASVIILLGTGLLLVNNTSSLKQIIAVQKEKLRDKDSSGLSFLHHEINTTGKEKTISLSDRSLIVLADKSELSYYQPFREKREIFLTGKAYFKVSHDPAKPFVVTSGDLTTVDLGTEFMINAVKNARLIVVRLYQGKVAVKAVDKGNKKMKNDVYLLPCQELIYGGPTVQIRNFRLQKGAGIEKTIQQELSAEDPSIPENSKVSYFMFNNRPLEEVFDQLAEIYNVKVIYNKTDISNLYFIGKYNSSTSVETILKRIATLNNLTINKQGSAFIVSR